MSGNRPALVLVAMEMGRHEGSERGRGWAWAFSLARHYRLHVVAPSAVVTRCQHEDLAADWQWHPTRAPYPRSGGVGYYRAYRHWCREVTELVRTVAAGVRPVAVHHCTLGSFRVLPRYDRCDVPFVLGPLGGGEVTPRALLPGARLPLGPRLAELLRPTLNDAFTLVPGLRAVLTRSRLALATSEDTQRVLRRMGARTTAVVFPDRLPADVDPARAEPMAERSAALESRVRLVWSGRAVWWKAGQLAIELLRRLATSGVDAELTVFAQGPALPAWQAQLQAAGLAGRCRINGFVARHELLSALGRAHAFVYPTLHDSSAPALLEAYAMGLPSLTVGLGGPAVIATPETGYNVRPPDLDTWLDGAAAVLRGWRREPATWRTASAAARRRSEDFGAGHLDTLVDRWLAPDVLAR